MLGVAGPYLFGCLLQVLAWSIAFSIIIDDSAHIDAAYLHLPGEWQTQINGSLACSTDTTTILPRATPYGANWNMLVETYLSFLGDFDGSNSEINMRPTLGGRSLMVNMMFLSFTIVP